MSSAPTLHSRLRVLVAKTFRASQLYSSMRTGRGESSGNLGEIANDVRAGVWYKVHAELQSGLNDALELGSAAQTANKVLQLKQHFEKMAIDAQHIIERGSERLVQSVHRQEFSTTFKASLELIKCKAKMQASRVIADELDSILNSTKISAQLESVFEPETPSGSDSASNVIPLRRRVSR
ncbi:MAG: hypothetical protein KDD66_17480 [Bdellovibrionales bacterium]|nr:hypothetical protein [Bdellovibrionales bacterium]